MIIKEVMNSERDRNQILLKTLVIVPYYLFFVMELRSVLFINFVCYFTEFKVREFKFVIIPLLTVKIERSPNLAIITVHIGLYNNYIYFL